MGPAERSVNKQVLTSINFLWMIVLKRRPTSPLGRVTPNEKAVIRTISKSLKVSEVCGARLRMMPSSIEATLVQGASFVFEGRKTVLEHYDESSGAHLSIDDLLDAALSK